MLLNWRATIASAMLSLPSICRPLIAAPTRNEGANACRSVVVSGLARVATPAHPAVLVRVKTSANRADETIMKIDKMTR